MASKLQTRWWIGGSTALACGSLLVGWWAGNARALGIPSPNALVYSGMLTEQGVPVQGSQALSVVLHSTDGSTPALDTQLCSTTVTTTVTQGRFTISLPDACTTAIATTANAWAEVLVGGQSFGYQRIGAVPYAVMANAVNGQVNSTAVLPSYAADGTLGRGAGGASIHNDSTLNSLVVQGSNSTSPDAGPHNVLLKDNVTAAGNLNVSGTEAVGGAVSASKFSLGAYVVQVTDTGDVYCNAGDLAASGGFYCHDDYDQISLQSYPDFTDAG